MTGLFLVFLGMLVCFYLGWLLAKADSAHRCTKGMGHCINDDGRCEWCGRQVGRVRVLP